MTFELNKLPSLEPKELSSVRQTKLPVKFEKFNLQARQLLRLRD